jgi:hypothetical protein
MSLYAESLSGPATHVAAKRVAMAGATAFLSVNLWTGAPLLALWVGSRVVGQRALSMGAIFVVVIVLAVEVFSIAFALAWLNRTYDQLVGRPPGEYRLAWLRSMNAGGTDATTNARGITMLERIVMASVYSAVIALVIWFFLFAKSPLPA